MIRITSRRAGFRRAGIAHPDTPTDYPDDHFTEGQLAQLKTEPMLVVEEFADTEPSSDGSEKPNRKRGEK